MTWYLDLIASWGLLPTTWATQTNPPVPMMIGVVAGLFGFVLGIAMPAMYLIEGGLDYGHKFDDNALTRAGYRLSVVVISIVGVACSAALCAALAFGVVTLVAGLLLAKPLLTLLALLLIGPLLIVAGKMEWRKPNLSLRRKQEATAQIPSHDSYEEALKHHGLSDEDFYDLDLGNDVVIKMPK